MAADVPDTSTWVQFTSFTYTGKAAAVPGTGEYLNPIVAGFHPDPSIRRVGDDYYLVNSAFNYFPSIPIWHSKDLVNWTQIGNVIERPSQFAMHGGAVSAGTYAPTIRHPNAVITVKGPDIRWVGNENGTARETEWSVIGLDRPEAEFQWPDMTGKILGDRETLRKAAALHWYPAEANVSILPGWFYHNDRNLKSAERLMDLYERSVGHNASFLINIPPDKRGLFSDAEVAALKAFGELRQNRYGINLATDGTAAASSSLPDHSPSDAMDGKYETYWEAATQSSVDGPVTLEITLPRLVTYRRIVLQEQIKRGQRVEAFTVEAEQPDGTWQMLAEATTIGYKRILAVPETNATHLRIRFGSYRVAPTIAEVALFC
jgi:alpha-L-fucosidase